MVTPTYDVFRHLLGERSDAYRAVMREFVEAKERFIVHLRPAEMAPGAGGDDLASLLQSLVEWGNLRADPDTSRVASVEDFNRARFVYQMTPAGEAAERALARFDSTLGVAGALQAAALADIVDQLRAVLLELRADETDAMKVALGLETLASRFEALAQNAQTFSGDLQRTIDLRGIDTEAFLAYKERLIGYLDRFIRDLIVRTAEVAELLDDLAENGVERALAMVSDREARDLPPAPDGTDPRDAILDRWRRRFSGFRQWFVGTEGRVSQSLQLRRMASTAIPELLRVVERLAERSAGRTDRSAELRSLARWFAETPTDAARHRLAAVAFGLHAVRHLSIDDDTLAARAREHVPANTPWAEAPAIEISPRLRATGSYERRGMPNRIRDRDAERRTIAVAVEAQRVSRERLEAQLLTDGFVALSDLAITDPEARSAMLSLLGDALARRRSPAEPVSVTSLDGAFRVEVEPDPTGRSRIELEDGTLTGPGHRLRITRVES